MRTRFLRICVAAFSTFAALAAGMVEGESVALPDASEATRTCAVTIRVVDSARGVPAEGALVQLASDPDGQILRTLETDAGGVAELSDLEESRRYQLVAMVPGRVPGSTSAVCNNARPATLEIRLELPTVTTVGRVIREATLWHRRHVVLEGFLILGFEANALYDYADDAKYGRVSNAVWLEMGPEDAKKYKRYAGRFVSVEGSFDAYHLGHLGLFSGSIRDIKLVTPLQPGSEGPR